MIPTRKRYVKQPFSPGWVIFPPQTHNSNDRKPKWITRISSWRDWTRSGLPAGWKIAWTLFLCHCVTSWGFRNIIFVWYCLLFSALTQLWPTGGVGSRLTVSLKSPAQTPGEKTSGCFYEQHLLSPPSLHPHGLGSAVFGCFCHRCIGQQCTSPAVSIFCLTACSLHVMMLSWSHIKTSQQRSAGLFKNLWSFNRSWKHDSRTGLAPGLTVIAS